jgi:hypothetical protein
VLQGESIRRAAVELKCSPLFSTKEALTMKRLLVGVVIALSLYTPFHYPQHSEARAVPRGEVKIDLLVPPGTPVKISSASVKTINGRGLSELTFSVVNESGSRISNLRLGVFVIGVSRRTKAGEGWKETVDLEPNSTKTITATLNSKVVFGDRAIVAVQSAAGEAGVWEVGWPDIFDAVRASERKQPLPAAQRSALTVEGGAVIRAAVFQTTTFCRDRLREAKDACAAGIESFSCDEKNQPFSFSCQTAPIR